MLKQKTGKDCLTQDVCVDFLTFCKS